MSIKKFDTKELQKLLRIFGSKSYEAGGCKVGSLEYEIVKSCQSLLQRDCTLIEFDNTNGIMCPSYPSRIFIPEFQIQKSSTVHDCDNDNNCINIDTDDDNSILCDMIVQEEHKQQEQKYYNDAIDNNIETYVNFANPLDDPQQQLLLQSQMVNSTEESQDSEYQNININCENDCNEEEREDQEEQDNLDNSQQQETHEISSPSEPILCSYVIYNSNNNINNTNEKHNVESIIMPNGNINTVDERVDIKKLRDLITMAKYARCRQRFVIPVIMCHGKYICRSATISVSPETYCRKAVNCAYAYITRTNSLSNYPTPITGSEMTDDQSNDKDLLLLNYNYNLQQQHLFSYEEAIKNDILLLNYFKVNTIIDLMVEHKKIKYYMAVSSSEKADHENRYKNFELFNLPYPGCEFFKSFRDNNYVAKNLYYDWSQPVNDAILTIPTDSIVNHLSIKWPTYKQWDLVLMTQNYLKACLKHIKDDKSGLLIHCISGWDRTPLFISLIRLSLWADNLIHQSLDPVEITYLTVAYDWYLFGHQLPDRVRRYEDIMFFCFDVLCHLTGDEFTMLTDLSSPVYVPIINNNNCERKRNESSSSSSSWQNVDFTGSVNGSVKFSSLMESDSPPRQTNQGTTHMNTLENDTLPSNTINNNGCDVPHLSTQRYNRLTGARTAFHMAYSRSVGLKPIGGGI